MTGDATDGNGRDQAPLTRLLDGPPDASVQDQDGAWAVELLREAPAYRPRAGERQRVLLGLRRPRVAARHVWAIRVAATAAALVAATTFAWAGLGHLPQWLTALARPEPHAAVPPPHAPSSVVRRSPVQSTVPAPPAPQARPSFIAAPPSEMPRPSRRRLAPAPGSDDDSALVVRAMRALRREGDPALARALSRAYLERRPTGALAEEALALTVEAAVAHQDPDAAALGARYLHQYPNGPFRGLARQASRRSDVNLQP